MGVKGLQSYVQNRLPLTDYIVELASLRAGAANAVVVDGMALIRKLYEQSRRLWKSSRPELRPTRRPARRVSARSSSGQLRPLQVGNYSQRPASFPHRSLDWVGGGQFLELWCNVRDFVGAFRGAGLRLIVFFDGGVDDAKLDEWLSRRKRDLSNCDKALRTADMQSRRAPQPCRTHAHAHCFPAYQAYHTYQRRRAACPSTCEPSTRPPMPTATAAAQPPQHSRSTVLQQGAAAAAPAP